MVSIKLDDAPPLEEVRSALSGWRGRPQELKLPSAPPAPVVCMTEANRPQPRLDVGRDGGMTISVGRIRPCPVLGLKLVALGHNTIRGAAGAAVLNAELMIADGWIEGD
jgi:aspartate-semialdehyde dehydrogenase